MFCPSCQSPNKQNARFCASCGGTLPAVAVSPAPAPALPTSGRLSMQTVLGGRYQILEQLGRGGMGNVYLALDRTFTSKTVVVKEMIAFFNNETEEQYAHRRFLAEADTLAQLNHPGIPQVYDRFLFNHRYYLVMEHIRGLDLQKTVEKHAELYGTPLPQDLVLEILCSLIHVLEYLHGLEPPIIHRDLKPANILLTAEGRLKLVDFGIAKSTHGAQAGTKIGTQGYAAPEQFKGFVSPLSDIYALGATLHHLLTNRDPQQEMPFDFPPLRTLNPSVTPDVEALVHRMLAVSPQERPPSVQDVRRRLLAFAPDVEKSLHQHRRRDDAVSQLIAAFASTSEKNTPSASPSSLSQLFCPNCGTANRRETRFCRECGGHVPHA
ncbi:protein kinase domain-containing protein [Tumebacillus flagellatus]|uniref:non-specific serine/threonine protein kinase n=1 Tax=Tumebacillus flagellatus TaxID=1157490 RepID=A0A074LJR3_9BACL|nr:protein kinase [Tumebacillus flagellatus]KEO81339.1 hypothetical protein EL26_21110 [Tumebacillus flagellatus]